MLNIMKMLISFLVFFSASMLYAEDRLALTQNPDHRAFVTQLINQDLQQVNKQLKVSKITQILSDYDPESGIYFLETEFKFKDAKNKTYECSTQVTTNGLNKHDDHANVPYVCFRIAGLG